MVGELHGKVALITGAGTGIGRATALTLAEAGANVLVHYSKSQEDAEMVVKLVKDLGRQARSLQADFSDRAAVSALAESAEEHWGRVDILINNAAFVEPAADGVTKDADFAQHLTHWDRAFDINLRAPFELTAKLGKRMAERGSGTVVNVCSIAGMFALTDAPLYSLTKSALLHFTRQAARQYAPQVRVNAIAPGWTATGFGGGYILDPEFQRQVSKRTPLKRVADADEIAGAIAWLVKDATFMTGSTLTMDGGQVSELR